MTFFDITPAGAFFNATNAAAKSDEQFRQRNDQTKPQSVTATDIKTDYLTSIRTVFTSAKNLSAHGA